MVAITKTNEKNYDTNLIQNRTYIYVCRKEYANQIVIDWKHKDLIYWSKYEIKETDMRQETATFTSPQYFDLTTGVFCVLISSPYHKNFAGVILSNEYDDGTGLYTYQCQDFSRVYQSKCDLVAVNLNVHRLLKYLITRGGIDAKGKISKKQAKEWKNVLSGLRPSYQYEQKYYGAKKNFNPMTENVNMIIKGKSWIEVIRDIVYGSGAYIDVYFDSYGICHINPYHKNDLKKGLVISANTLTESKIKFDTTNVVTGTIVQSSENLKVGTYYDSSDVVNLDLRVFFGYMTSSITNQNNNAKSNQQKVDKKKASTTKNKNNPYNTKKKNIYISTDNISSKASDNQFMKDIAKKLEKNGWKTKIIGRGSNTHSESYMKNNKDGIWFCIYGGIDAALLKEACGKNSYTNKLKKNNLRTVIGMRQGGDIRKGGEYYKYLPRAHDDNYSPSSFKGVSYPLKMLTKGKVPIMYANTTDKMVSKFLAGGDNPDAC